MFRKTIILLVALSALTSPALAGSQKPLVSAQQIQPGDTLALQPSTTGGASINIPQGVAPTTPINGDCWTTNSAVQCQINSATLSLGSTSAPDLPTRFSMSTTNIPFSLGTNGFGLGNSSFAINYAPTSGTSGDALQVYRTDNWTGGTSGQVTAAQRTYITCPAGRLTYCWSGVFVIDNSSTSTDGSQNVAIYGQALKKASGTTWAATFEAIDSTAVANPVAGMIAVEADTRANGTDNSNNRVGIDVVGTRVFSGGIPSGAAGVTGFAYRAQTGGDTLYSFTTGYGFGASAKVAYAFDCAPATVTAICLRLAEGQTVDFSSASGRPLFYVTSTSQWRFNNNSTLSAAFNVGANGVIQFKVLTVSQLPTCNAVAQGSVAYVSDISGAATYNGAVTGGGTTQSTVLCNGTSWTQH